jgi:hypothetical protein
VTWSGDHEPHHVHVYRDDELILKWGLDSRDVMEGHATRRIVRLIRELELEGRL